MLRPACLKISLFLVVLLFLKASQHIAPGSSVWIDIKGHSKGQGWSMCQKLIMPIWVCPDKYIGWKLLIPRYCVLTNKLIWNFSFCSLISVGGSSSSQLELKLTKEILLWWPQSQAAWWPNGRWVRWSLVHSAGWMGMQCQGWEYGKEESSCLESVFLLLKK